MSINLQNISTEELLKELENRGYKVTKIKTKKANTGNTIDISKLINPVTYHRDNQETALRIKLEEYTIEELIKMCKIYTPDMNRTIYRSKNKEKVIEYIIQRSSKLSVLGEVFKTLDTSRSEQG